MQTIRAPEVLECVQEALDHGKFAEMRPVSRQDDDALADRAAHDLADLMDHRTDEARALGWRRQVGRGATVEVEAARAIGLQPITNAAVDVRCEFFLGLDQHR